MDMYPEFFAGDLGLTAISFATGTCDIAAGGAATFGTVELFNPAIANPQATGQVILATLTGLMIFNTTAAGNLKVLKSVTATDVATAATVNPVWMDFRRTDTPVLTLKSGVPAAIPGTELIRFPMNSNERLFLPFNWDIQPGTGINFAFDTANQRLVVSPIWVERIQTS